MADNVTLNAGAGGVVAAADEISAGVYAQRVKPVIGADGTGIDVIPVSNGLDTTATGVPAAGMVAQFDDAATGTVTENQFAPVRMSSRRALLVEGVASGTVIPVSDGGGNLSIDDGGNSITVDGPLTDAQLRATAVPVDGSGVTQPVSNAGLTELAAAINASSQVDVNIAAAGAAVPVTDNGGNLSIDDGGNSITVDGTVTASNTTGNVAHDAADSGNPVKIGGRADTTFQTAAADGDRVDALFDVYGVQQVRGDHPNKWSYHDDDTAAVTTDGTVQSAPGAGLSVYITDIVFSIGAATASGIFLEEGTTKILGIYYLEAIAGRSIHIRFATPKKCTANTAILVTNTGSVSFAIDILGFIAP